ncbi:Guanosine-diphosphatase [Linnemannia hyalina]|uniref:guanosine-diphosphatase n=1 Tax=Linnemannia hyalina TaxID=64524 RepID=A0A9P7XRX2_9FUNG|nr:Guanosine-diphosphatase [Linnemannia hyalina]
MTFAEDYRNPIIPSDLQQEQQQHQPHHLSTIHHHQQDHISFAPEPTATNNPTKLVKRNSLKLAKRISSSSLLPSNYSTKNKSTTPTAASSSSPSTRARRSSSAASNHLRNNSNLRHLNSHNKPSKAGALFQSILHHPVVMSLKDNIMARKGYWLRNGAILFFGLTLFFFVMLPKSEPNLHDNIPVAHPERPLIQYVLMIDAGSSGSRIHVYKFNYCKATPELESEVFKMLEPGLSKYGDDAQGAAKSLDPLLEAALESVPKFLHKSTPVAVKATAGLRLLGPEKSNRILEAVRHRLETVYPFPIIKEQGVAVMDGGDEGVYAWVTVNYLLGRISSIEKTPTVAIMDLGGASTQIVFEPLTVNGHSVAQGPQRVPMSFNGNNYVLFQHSYLNYGLNEANKAINNYVIENPIDNTEDINLSADEYLHPCMPVDSRKKYLHGEKEVTLIGVSDTANECRRVVEAIFYKDKACSQNPCSFNGVYQPSLATSFNSDIYAFSYIFDRITPFLAGSDVPIQDITLQQLEELTERVCVADEDAFKEFDSVPTAKTELGRVAEMCMDLNYIYGLFQYGYGIPKGHKINLTKKIRDYETGWCLGASIAVLEDRWYLGA